DGVDSGKSGGTWDVVKGFMEGKICSEAFLRQKGNYILHHLFTPRISNRIPSAQVYLKKIIFPRKIYDWETTQLKVSGVSTLGKACKKCRMWFKANFSNPSDIIYRFILPLFLVLSVLVPG